MVAAIDILVVAFLIYEFLKLLKGTRRDPMLVAVILIVAAIWIAHIEQLRTVDWLITTLFPYAVFALIVVFGAEIRHALARLGRRLSARRGESLQWRRQLRRHRAGCRPLFQEP